MDVEQPCRLPKAAAAQWASRSNQPTTDDVSINTQTGQKFSVLVHCSMMTFFWMSNVGDADNFSFSAYLYKGYLNCSLTT